MLILFVFLVYRFGWDWTGFNSGTSQITIISTTKGNYAATILQPSKSLWDWLNLLGVLAIPVVAGLGVAWFTHVQQRRDQHIADQRAESERKDIAERAKLELEKALDNQREVALQEYIDKMSELLLHEKLRESDEDDCEVRKIARVRTLTVLPRLDGERKGSVVQFLYESGLIKDKRIVNLSGADLSQANLLGFILAGAYLNEVNLSYANMQFANLIGANLNIANLFQANLYLADLSGANLSRAFVTDEQLAKAKSLKGVTMPDGTKHP